MKVTKIEEPNKDEGFFGGGKEPMDFGKKIIVGGTLILALVTIFMFLKTSSEPKLNAPEKENMEEQSVLTSADVERIEKKELKAELDKIETEDTYKFNELSSDEEKQIEEKIKERNKGISEAGSDFSKRVEAERNKLMEKKASESGLSDLEYNETLKKEKEQRENSINEEVKKSEEEQQRLDETINSIENEMEKIREQEQRDQG